METRKLQKVGGGTYTISIPKSWADEHGLEVGADVHIYTHHDGSIVLRSAEKDGGILDQVAIEISGDEPELVTRCLRALHVIGFEKVTLVPETRFTEEQRRSARQVKQDLVGTELLVEREDEITVKNLLDTADISVRQSLVQLKFIVLSINREAMKAYREGSTDITDRLADQVTEADRILDMITRHFNRAMVSLEEIDLLGVSRPVLFDYYATAIELQQVAHLSLMFAGLIDQRSGSDPAHLEPELRNLAETSREFIDQSISAVLRSDEIRTAHEALSRWEEVEAQVLSLESEIDDDAANLASAVETLLLTVDHGGRIAEIALLAAVRTQHL